MLWQYQIALVRWKLIRTWDEEAVDISGLHPCSQPMATVFKIQDKKLYMSAQIGRILIDFVLYSDLVLIW